MANGFNFKESTKQKISKQNMDIIANELVKKSAEEILNNIQDESVGVSQGQIPSGGAPVWQGDPKLDHNYPGYLRDTHYIEHKNMSSVIKSDADYVWYVINGHIIGWSDGMVNIPPNPYHKRSLDRFVNENKLQEVFVSVVNEHF